MLIRSINTMVKFHIPVLLPLSSGITAGFEKFWFNFPLAAVLLEVLPKYDFWIYCFDRSLNFFPPTYIQFHCSSLRIWSIHAFIFPNEHEQHFTRDIRRYWTISYTETFIEHLFQYQNICNIQTEGTECAGFVWMHLMGSGYCWQHDNMPDIHLCSATVGQQANTASIHMLSCYLDCRSRLPLGWSVQKTNVFFIVVFYN